MKEEFSQPGAESHEDRTTAKPLPRTPGLALSTCCAPGQLLAANPALFLSVAERPTVADWMAYFQHKEVLTGPHLYFRSLANKAKP